MNLKEGWEIRVKGDGGEGDGREGERRGYCARK